MNENAGAPIYAARSCQLPPRKSPRVAYLPCQYAEISKKPAIATSGNSQGGNITHGVVRYGAIHVFVRTDSESTLAFSCQRMMSFNPQHAYAPAVSLALAELQAV